MTPNLVRMIEPSRDGVALIFPVGHEMGLTYVARPAPNAYLEREYETPVSGIGDGMALPDPRPLRAVVEPKGHRVRIADRSVRLSDEEVAIWRLTHGAADGTESRPLTRTMLDEQARADGHREPDRLIDRLLERGALVEASPGTADAVAFARRHRLRPLMVGFGNTAEEPSSFGVGYADQPVVRLPRDLYLVWQWSDLSDLWATCERLAGAAAEPDSSPSSAPEGVVTRVLGALHFLLAHHVVYLDRVSGS
ncbi:hypothetical protein SAMN04489713_124105 [Actinomadura madurae]|uniref:Uncharacterized protein n=2 Tax=Actinomadura madurae TaxID=1993 RepID=A0A1I5WRP9_9ACTN|nr:hypothetical protein SAMN04489713_124105 [Actinomadura madurae]